MQTPQRPEPPRTRSTTKAFGLRHFLRVPSWPWWLTVSQADPRSSRAAHCSIMRQYATSSYMRKWMTERLKRRKKPGEGSAKEATSAPEPLQPRFYDNEDATTAAPVAG